MASSPLPLLVPSEISPTTDPAVSPADPTVSPADPAILADPSSLPTTSAQEAAPLRRSARSVHPPAWLGDYVSNTCQVHYAMNTIVKPKFQAFLSGVTSICDPVTFQEAV